MSDIANKDESRKCLAIARQAILDDQLEKAEKFALKAQRLYASMEVCLELAPYVLLCLPKVEGRKGSSRRKRGMPRRVPCHHSRDYSGKNKNEVLSMILLLLRYLKPVCLGLLHGLHCAGSGCLGVDRVGQGSQAIICQSHSRAWLRERLAAAPQPPGQRARSRTRTQAVGPQWAQPPTKAD